MMISRHHNKITINLLTYNFTRNHYSGITYYLTSLTNCGLSAVTTEGLPHAHTPGTTCMRMRMSLGQGTFAPILEAHAHEQGKSTKTKSKIVRLSKAGKNLFKFSPQKKDSLQKRKIVVVDLIVMVTVSLGVDAVVVASQRNKKY